VSIDVRVDTSELQGLVKQLQTLNARGIDFATGKFMTDIGFAVRKAWQSKAQQVFDNPTPFTVNSVQVKKWNRGTRTVSVGFRDELGDGTPPAKYLQAQAFGGDRRDKRFERALRAQGLLPPGMQTFPTKDSPLDAYGNFAGGYKKRIMAQLRVFQDSKQNETDESRDRKEKRAAKKGNRVARLFVLQTKKGRMPAGIYERVGFNFGGQNVSAVRMIIAYGRTARYRPRFDAFAYAQQVVNREGIELARKAITAEIDRALAKAARAAGNGAA
jgi:hypothetical protein